METIQGVASEVRSLGVEADVQVGIRLLPSEELAVESGKHDAVRSNAINF